MLNCTDLACVLHHHHFYAHLHHLKHHLQDDSDHTAFGGGNNLENNENTQTNTNETDSELSSLSHVDAPNDIIYTICGVVIAMVLVAVIIILVAVTINKLRKREESSTTLTTVSPTTIDAQQSSFALHSQTNSVHTTIFSNNSPSNGGCNLQHQDQQVFVTTTTTSLVESNGVVTNCTDSNSGSSGPEQLQVTFTRTSGTAPNSWVFPPKAPTPNIYNCLNNDTLLITNEKTGLKGLGFRKQFSGRFKRLVSKKQEPIQAIPPELKPQLKTIYVY